MTIEDVIAELRTRCQIAIQERSVAQRLENWVAAESAFERWRALNGMLAWVITNRNKVDK